MMWWLRELLTPFAYLNIRHGQGLYYSKRFLDFVLPIIVGVLIYLIYRYAIGSPNFFGLNGFMEKFSRLFELLAAFYLAALAAVASLDRRELDEKLRGRPAEIKRWSNRKSGWVWVELTRRQYVCYLFSYLSAASLIFAIGWPFVDAASTKISPLDGPLSLALFAILKLLFFSFLANIWICTLHGIYFLGDRINPGEAAD